jgi:hypothetical protein
MVVNVRRTHFRMKKEKTREVSMTVLSPPDSNAVVDAASVSTGEEGPMAEERESGIVARWSGGESSKVWELRAEANEGNEEKLRQG